MKIEVVIPAHNEQAIISETVLAIAKVLDGVPGLDWKITVADNGSTDDTEKAVLQIKNPRVAVYCATGKGKGLALREVFARSGAEIVGFFDADLSVDPGILPTTLSLVGGGTADIVIGSRFHPESRVDRGAYRSSSSRFFNLLARAIVGVAHADTQCGYKFMNQKGKEVFARNKENTWFFDLEFLARAGREGLRIQEVPVAWTEFRYAGRKSKLHPLKDGLNAVMAMLRIRSAQ